MKFRQRERHLYLTIITKGEVNIVDYSTIFTEPEENNIVLV